MGRYNLSPSRVARYYFHECDRFLRYTATPKDQKVAEGIPPYDEDRSLLTKAILKSGYDWEGEVLDTHLSDSAVIAPPPPDNPAAPKTDRVHSVASTIEALRHAAPGQYIYQPTLIATDGFYDRYDLDRELIEFGECRPDLLMITAGDDGAKQVTVLDLKATDESKLSHKIQSTLYTLILEHALADHGVADLATTREGGVWLYQHTEPELFDLSSVRPPLELFLTQQLQPILEAPASEAFWHLYFRCEWCEFHRHCRSEAEATDDVSLVPYLTTFAKRHLAKTAEVRTVDDLARFLERDDAPEIMQGSASLRGKARRLALSVDSIATGTTHQTGAASVAMPIWDDIRIVLTLQSEPLSGSIYGYAIERFGGGPPKQGGAPHVFGEWKQTLCRVARSEDEQTKAELRRNLIRDLMAILRPVHDFNTVHSSDQEWRLRKSVQVYVFDTYERELLVQALLESVQDTDLAVAQDAMSLFFHFQHPDLAAVEDHPADEVYFPVIVLTSVIRSLFALPIKVSYRFADVVAALKPTTSAFGYQHNDYFDFELSNRLRSDGIFYVWFKDRDDIAKNIEGHLKRRVWATSSTIKGIRERLKPTGALFAWSPKFSLPPGAGFSNPLLSRLAFISRYEFVMKYLGQRARRTNPEPERLAAGDSLKLTFIEGDRYRVDAGQAEIEVEADGYLNWILTHDNPEGRKARLAYDDAWYRAKWYPPKNAPVALAAVTQEPRNGVLRLRLDPAKEKFALPKPGDVLTLDGRVTDPLIDGLITELAALDRQQDPWFTRMVADPVGTRQRITQPAGVLATVKELASRAGFTASQMDAFTAMVDHDLQLVWGPPGTGKTHFLASAILCLAEAHRRHELPLRVLLTGFTNAAIDNALRKLIDLAGNGIYQGNLPIRKIVKDKSDVAVAVKPKAAAAQFAQDNPICVLGTTVWQARKTEPQDLIYDLVVIDEGSQLKVAETAIPVRRLRPGGRLLIAGDDRQLPPIVQGDYPVTEGEPLLHRSILEALRERDPQDVTVAPLLENFRMCDVLCTYPASSIYPAAYAPANREVADRRLSFRAPLPDGFLGKVLDPAHPMVMCVMEEASGAAENLKEARLVAAVAVKLRELLPEGTDEEFWAERLFIVSPHHAQIRAINKELHKRRDWDATPFVDTVDKMQGQECDVVLVSYGVADVETALQQKEFIYSLNRLNVAITRARMKTVVFLSRSLLEPPLQALDQEDVANGIAFMQGLAADPSTMVISV
jgi:DNA replication ATP-dependent helicase Dna2